MSNIKRRTRFIKGGAQRPLFSDIEPVTEKPVFRKGFVTRDPEILFVGDQSLRRFLEDSGLHLPLQIRDMMSAVDFSAFEEKYDLHGRAPYHPSLIMGLVIYGIIKNQASLRQLEVLARLDLGAHWITGGIMPDHATIGRFLSLHGDVITTEFFENLTAKLLKSVGQPTTEWAIDGTVVESAANRFRVLKLDVAKEILDSKVLEQGEAQNGPKTDEDPDDDPPASAPDDQSVKRPKMSKKTRETLKPDKLNRAVETGEFANERRKRYGADPRATQVCTTDPDAMILRTKQHAYRPAYVVSLAATPSRMILSFDLDSCSEIASVEALLKSAERVGGPPKNLLMDTGYHCVHVAKLAQESGARLICPPKRSTVDPQHTTGKFSQHIDFEYISDEDAYLCPAGNKLTYRLSRYDKRRNTHSRVYQAPLSTCRNCKLQSQCTTDYRKITRMDHLSEVRETYADPDCQALYAKRMGCVEPVFASVKTDLGLNRFKRFGKRGALLDLALRACAHNVKTAARLALLWLIQAVLEAFAAVGRHLEAVDRQFPNFAVHRRPILAA